MKSKVVLRCITAVVAILAAAMFASSAAVSIIYSERLGVSTDIAAALNPISTILMIPIMSLVVMGTMGR